jgi:3-methyladenine DNA glycosylase AlkD
MPIRKISDKISLSALKTELKSYYNKERSEHSKRFFKTGPGEYGEGDIFYGLKVPEMRHIAKKYLSLSFSDIERLLHSKIHEERFLALIILVYNFEKSSDEPYKKEIFDIYTQNTRWINNWDLVDVSAPNIVGRHLFDKDRKSLYKFAKSDILWEKRISIISTLYFIRKKDFDDTLKIAEILLEDNHDLIHKAVGWMLREIGKRDREAEERFLKKYHKIMPRTMLRYSIERFPDQLRKKYLER